MFYWLLLLLLLLLFVGPKELLMWIPIGLGVFFLWMIFTDWVRKKYEKKNHQDELDNKE